MAKDITLTVQVTDVQFQQFVKSFNSLSQNFTQLTNRMNAFSTQINSVSQNMHRATASSQTMLQSMKGIYSLTGQITKHIFRWGAVISGISTLLGAGGLFGMGRLANVFMDRQRFMMGLGGADWGATQTAQTLGKSVLQDPNQMLEGIATAQTDYTSMQRRALQNVFGNEFDKWIKKDPTEIASEYLRRLPGKLQEWTGGDPGKLGPIAGTRGLTTLNQMQDLRRAMTEPKEFTDLATRMDAARRTGPSPEQAKAWEDFWKAVREYTNTIQNDFIKALAPLAGPMAQISKSMADLVTALAEMPEVKQSIQSMSSSMQDFANYLKSEDAQKSLKALIDSLVFNLKDLVSWVEWIASLNKIKGGDVLDYAKKKGSEIWERRNEPMGGTSPAPSTSAPAAPSGPGGNTFGNAAAGIGDWFKRPLISSPAPGQSVGSPLSGAPPTPFSFGGPPSGAESAVRGRIPTPSGAPGAFFPGPPGQGQQPSSAPGPLDLSNWQDRRQTSLIVKGVPSANVFLAANAMG